MNVAVNETTVRLSGGQTSSEGVVEINVRTGENDWAPVCGEGWSSNPQNAEAVCKSLNLG